MKFFNEFYLQLTWFPNELEGFDLVLFEFLDRLNEPKGTVAVNDEYIHSQFHIHRLVA